MDYPIVTTVEAANREALRDAVKALREREPLSNMHLGAAWTSSKTDVEFNAAPCLEPLKAAIAATLPTGRYDFSAWGSLLMSHEQMVATWPPDAPYQPLTPDRYRGDRIDRHNHAVSHKGGPNQWAAIYYVRGAGVIVFHTPDGDRKIEVQPGTLLVFPATLEHSVPRHTGDNRVCVAFNIKILGEVI